MTVDFCGGTNPFARNSGPVAHTFASGPVAWRPTAARAVKPSLLSRSRSRSLPSMALSRSKMVAIVATGFNYTISHQLEAPADIAFPQQLMNLSWCAADPSAAGVSRNPRPSPSIVRSCSWLVVLAAWQAMHRLDDNASAVMLSAYSQPHGGSVGPSRNTSYERANSVIWGLKEGPILIIQCWVILPAYVAGRSPSTITSALLGVAR